VAVVPTFHPGPRVRDLVLALHGALNSVSALEPTGRIIVTDDASPCTFDPVLADLAGRAGVQVLRHAHNAGIARGLNEGLAVAQAAGARWLLTVDQDSQITPLLLTGLLDLAEHLSMHDDRIRSDHTRRDRVGVVAPGRIEDASGVLDVPGVPYPIPTERRGAQSQRAVLQAPEVMQSGALWSVAALAAIGGFDTSLSMDGVDAAACLSLRESGFLVLIDPDLTITHELGNPERARSVRILGRSTRHTAHDPSRRASMIRARLRLLPREWQQSPSHALRTIRRVAVGAGLAVAMSPDRWEQTKATMRGIREGVRR